jgi:small subunit ribosomal protein S20
MANIKSAQKQARQNEKSRMQNLARRTAIKTAIKKVHLSIEQQKDASQIEALLKDVAAKLARAKSKKVIHGNTAARKLSRLTKKYNKSQIAQAASASV